MRDEHHGRTQQLAVAFESALGQFVCQRARVEHRRFACAHSRRRVVAHGRVACACERLRSAFGVGGVWFVDVWFGDGVFRIHRFA